MPNNDFGYPLEALWAMAYRVSRPEEVHIFRCKAETRPPPKREPGLGSDLYQIKGGLRLYLLLDLDY